MSAHRIGPPTPRLCLHCRAEIGYEVCDDCGEYSHPCGACGEIGGPGGVDACGDCHEDAMDAREVAL